jgi:hypothetical protein
MLSLRRELADNADLFLADEDQVRGMQERLSRRRKLLSDILRFDDTITAVRLAEAFAAHDRMTADMEATQALIRRESEERERVQPQLHRARQDKQSTDERLMQAVYTDQDGYQGPWPSYQVHRDFINAHPDIVQVDGIIAGLEQELAEIETRQQALIRLWHQQEQDRAHLRRHATNLDELRELVRQRLAMEAEADTITALMDEKGKILQEDSPPDPFPERRAALLASVALGEAGAAEELAALDQEMTARAAAQAEQAKHRSEIAQLVKGLTAKLAAKKAEISQARERERLALAWHLGNEIEAEQARHDAAEMELSRAHLRIAALLNLTGADKKTHYPWLSLPNHPDTPDARAESRQREVARLASLGLDTILATAAKT